MDLWLKKCTAAPGQRLKYKKNNGACVLYTRTPLLYTRILAKKHVGLLSYIRPVISAECRACIIGSSSLGLFVDLPNSLCFSIVVFTIAIHTHRLCCGCNNSYIVQEVKILLEVYKG